ncbi:hypothetical protein P7K49_033090 [Saguinus oedipus]|uniref:Uncharacterized protein n=1 Tax=Saguinus oedipus TaxID=9490 RepID=A0ABQ9TQX2_SAGOE|nr:hypothetical protein P7K49_033090 [Saguinus oedipus]
MGNVSFRRLAARLTLSRWRKFRGAQTLEKEATLEKEGRAVGRGRLWACHPPAVSCRRSWDTPLAPWPPAPRTRSCRPLLWVLVAGLLLLAAACAVCVARPWAVSGAHASPSSVPSPRLRDSPELSPGDPAGFPDPRQVRRSPTLGRGSPGMPPPPLWDSHLHPASPTGERRPTAAPTLHLAPRRGAYISSRTPRRPHLYPRPGR